MAAPAPPTSVGDTVASSTPEGGDTGQNGPRSWERTWSTQEMRTEANNWSLAADAGLLMHLQAFSQQMITKSHEIGKEVDSLLHETKLTGVRVNNVINDFIMLANTQFVENRVYDEDVTQSAEAKEDEQNKKENEEKTREQRESELIPRVTTALKMGIDVIDQAFEKLDTGVVDTDSEEEEESTYQAEPILEAKDPYIHRCLPHLIGSPQFMEDDSVGLREDESDDDTATDHGSLSVSEDEGDEDQDEESETTEYSTSDSEEEDKEKVKTKKKQRTVTKSSTQSDDDESSDEDMFSVKKKPKKFSDDDESDETADDDDERDGEMDNDDEEEDEIAKAKAPASKPDFASELAAKIGGALPKKPPASESDEEKDNDGWDDEPAPPKRKSSRSDTFGNSVDERKTKKGKGKEGKEKGKGKGKKSKHADVDEDDLFGKSKNMDEEDDMFSKGGGGLFSSSSKGLFDDDEEKQGGGGLFSDDEAPKSSKQRKASHTSKGSDMFGEEDDKEKEHKEKRPRTKSGKLLPKGAVSVFGGEGDDFLSSMRSETSTDSHTVTKPKAQPAKAAGGGGGGGLFDDDEEEDDLFGGASIKNESTKKANAAPGKSSAAPKKSELFAEDDEEDDLFGNVSSGPRKTSKSITVEEDEEDKHEEVIPQKKAKEKKLPAGAVSIFGNAPNPMVAALKKQRSESEDSNQDWSEDEKTRSHSSGIGSETKTAAATPKTSGMFADNEDEDDLFSSKSVAQESKPIAKPSKDKAKDKPAPEKSSASRKDSLFGEDEDADDGDFFSSPKTAKSKKPIGGVSIFGGADILGTKSAQVENKKESAQPAVESKPPPRKATLSLFDDDDDDDIGGEGLFASKPKPASSTTTAAKSTPGVKEKPKPRGLFDDDDLLFGGAEEENPQVDLFSGQSPLKQPKETKPAVVPESKSQAAPKAKNSGSALFGEDDETDGANDLFGSISTKTISGVTETESTDTMEKEESAPEVKKPKKPVGGVSLFGGMDPASILKKKRTPSSSEDTKDNKEGEKKEAVEEKKEVKETEKDSKEEMAKKPAPKLKTGGLFGSQDEEDDLFSVPSKPDAVKVEGVTTSSSSSDVPAEAAPVVKPKKPAGAVSMFGGLDPTAVLKKKNVTEEAADAGKKSKKEEKKDKSDKKEDDTKDKPKPPPDEFFGEDEEEDDLFSPKKPVTKTPKPVPETAPKPTEDDKEKEVEAPPPATRPKKLAGAVSMFGGIDPFAAMKKKKTPTEEEKTEDDDTNKTEEASPDKDSHPTFIDPLAALSIPAIKSPPKPRAKPPTGVSQSKSNYKSLAFNPAAMLPGASHPSLKSLEKSGSVDFDQPPEAETLQSTVKDRAKVISRRRPQSRKARRLAATNQGDDIDSVLSPKSPTIPELPDLTSFDIPEPALTQAENTTPPKASETNPSEPSPVKKEETPEKVKSRDLFGNDDLLDDTSLPKRKSLFGGDGPSDSTDGKQDIIFGKDLFGGKGSSAKTNSDTQDDLFSGSLAKPASKKASETKVTSKQSSAPKPEPPSLDADDNIFSTPSVKAKNDVSAVLDSDDLSSPLASKAAGSKGSKPMASKYDDDDLFASPSSKKKSDVKEDKRNVKADANGENDLFSSTKSAKSKPIVAEDDDDIFADSSLNKKKESKAKPSESGAAKDDDDIFKDSSVTKKRPKKNVTKEANLLSDTTDIFSDIPEAKPKEPKKKTKKVVEKKSVFKDDVDDIFGDASVATVKSKKETKKKTTSSAKNVPADIDDIFDDPLS